MRRPTSTKPRWMIGNERTDAKEIPNYLNTFAVPLLQDVHPEGITVYH